MATPYSHPDPAVASARFRAACAHLAWLTRQGRHVFGPIPMSVPTMPYGLPQDWRYWGAFDRNVISRCDVLLVVMLPGWTDSIGIASEIGIALELGVGLEFQEPCAEALYLLGGGFDVIYC
jgi:hypothetical protein